MIRFVFGLLLAALFLQPVAEARQSQPVPEFTGVRFSGAGDVTRVILEADREIASDVFYEVADGRMSVLVDLPLAVWSLDGVTRSGGMADGAGLVLRYRYGQWGPEGSRLVLDLAQPAKVYRVLSLPPSAEAPSWRLAIDLSPASEKSFLAEARRDEKTLARRSLALAAASPAPPQDQPAAQPVAYEPVAAETRPVVTSRLPATPSGRKYVIVIDAGHGGKDPGAISKSKVQEKDVNLLAALALKAILEKDPRFDVKLTREDDRFIDLEDRVSIARAWGADLFISVHADSAENPDARGVSIYTLSERGQIRSETTAEENDWKIYEIEEEADEEVAGILKTFVTRETNSRSAIFAAGVLTQMEESGVPLLRNSHRKAGFVVLFAPDVPAVLVELGFLTNSEDVMRLISPDGRARTVRAIADAIDVYFRETERGPAGR